MKCDLFNTNEETFKAVIQDYLRMSSKRMIEIQTMEQKILFAEFFLLVTAFLEQEKSRVCNIIEVENYEKLMENLEDFRRQSMEQTNHLIEALTPLNEEFIESFNDIDDCYLQGYLAAYESVLETTRREFKSLLHMQEERLIEIGREIISMFV